MIVFVSGGARSGKSRFAEEKAIQVYEQQKHGDFRGRLVYVATAKNSDTEMAERIRYHQEGRSDIWQTIEEPFDLASVPLNTGMGDVILIDCLTIWLSNMLYQTQSHRSTSLLMTMEKSERSHYLIEIVDSFIEKAVAKQQTLVFVSNDVNEGNLVVVDPLVSDYINELEKIHRHIVDRADSAIQVTAGVPLHWKGEESP